MSLTARRKQETRIKHARKYIWRFVKQATIGNFGESGLVQPLVLNGTIAVVTFAVSLYFGAIDFTKFSSAVNSGLYVAVIIFSLIFTVSLIRVPFQLDREKQ